MQRASQSTRFGVSLGKQGILASFCIELDRNSSKCNAVSVFKVFLRSNNEELHTYGIEITVLQVSYSNDL